MKHLIFAGMVTTALLFTGCSVSVQPSTVHTKGLIPDHDGINSISVGESMYKSYDYNSYHGAEMLKKSHRIRKGAIFTAQIDKDGNTAYCARPYCFIDTDNDKAFDHFSPYDGYERDKGFNPTRRPLPYKLVTLKNSNFSGYSHQFTFEGYKNGLVTISYNEFTTDLFTPTNKQTASFNIETTPFTVSFKGKKFEIINLDTKNLTYRVLP